MLTGAPLFDANIFFPAAQSLQYNEHLFGVSLFTLPWAAAGASPVLAYNATWWLAWVLNGITAFALLRRFVGDWLASFVGSLAYVCSFYVMLHAHGHLHLIWIWPIPLSLLLLERWFDQPRFARLTAWIAIALIGILTSWYMAVILSVANVAMLLVLSTTSARTPAHEESAAVWRRRGLQLALAAVVVATCVYPFARHYAGMRAAPAEAAGLSADLASYLVPPENTLAGQWWIANVGRQPRSIWGEQTLFTGWIALALAAAGVASLARNRDLPRRAWVFPVLVVTGFLLSLGPAPELLGGSLLAPFGWLSALPGFAGMRAPARFALLLTLGVAGLVAIGVTAITRATGWRGRIATAALVPLMLAEWFVVAFPAGTPRPAPVPAIYRAEPLQTARSLVSLPDYQNATDWVLGGDYLYYSTAHWRPIANGFGRATPPNHTEAMQAVNRFPDSVEEFRRLGLQYVVVHADRFPDRAVDMLAKARESLAWSLVERRGSDYLFEIVAP